MPFSPARGTRSMTSIDRKSTRLNSSHLVISYAVFCLKKKKLKPISSAAERVQPRKPFLCTARRHASALACCGPHFRTRRPDGRHHIFLFFFFNDTAPTEIYTLSLHDALPIYCRALACGVSQSPHVPPQRKSTT